MRVGHVVVRGVFVALVGLPVGLLAGLSITMSAVGTASAATTVSIPASIDSTGSRDVGAALEQFLGTVSPGTTVEFPDHGRFRSDGVLRLTGLRDVTIEGHGSTLIAPTDGAAGTPPGPRYKPHWPRLREHVAIRGADSLVVRDLVVRGPNADGHYASALEGQAGFSVASSSHVSLERVAVSNTYGDGVYVAGKSSDVTVRDSTFTKIGRQGIAVVNASKVLVDGNHLDAIARSAIDVEPAVPQWSVTGLHVEKNEIGDFGNFALAAGGAGAGVNDLWFQDNHVTGGNGLAIFAGGPRGIRTDLHIIGNRSDATGRAVAGSGRSGVIQLARTDRVEVTGNDAPIAAGTPAVSLEGVCNLVMRDNHFPGASSDTKVVAECGASASSAKKAPANGKKAQANGKKAAAPGSASASRRRRPAGTTDRSWLIVGAVLAIAVIAGLGVVLLHRRRPTA